jgi:hypothetical protein
MARHADLAHDEDVERGTERGGDLAGHRHAAPGQAQHDDAWAPRERVQVRRETAPRIVTIVEQG